MSGRRQFNEDQVLDAAMHAFWRDGYQATSMAELEAATGLNKSSLYNSYGSKEALFGRCLERFGERYGSQLLDALNHADFKSGIEDFFARLVERLQDASLPKGCLATMAALELGGSESASAHLIEFNLEAVRVAFSKRCAQAVSVGQLPPETDCDALAAMFLAMTRGIAVLNRGHSDPTVVRAAVRGLLGSLNQAAPR